MSPLKPARPGQKRYCFVVDGFVKDETGQVVALRRPREGVYAWGTDPDDAVRRAEDALASLIDAEQDGEISRDKPVAEE